MNPNPDSHLSETKADSMNETQPTRELSCNGTGAALISKERERQISEEEWLSDHDDSHDERELARAAAAYIMHYVERQWLLDEGLEDRYRNDDLQEQWPNNWSEEWFKPYNRIRDLVRAGALVAAEIDRLLRAQGSEVHASQAPADSLRQQKSCDPTPLIEALRQIKVQVCGDRYLNWGYVWATTQTRREIADICDTALQQHGGNKE